MKRVAKILWQLPQALLGAVVFLLVNRVQVDIEDELVFVGTNKSWGLSLWPFVFTHVKAGANTLDHELGHAKQSLYLGSLYLLLVGLPSFIRAAVWRFDKSRRPADYYKGYPEAWADRLGGVTRSK